MIKTFHVFSQQIIKITSLTKSIPKELKYILCESDDKKKLLKYNEFFVKNNTVDLNNLLSKHLYIRYKENTAIPKTKNQAL